jgi:hypothetical protein
MSSWFAAFFIVTAVKTSDLTLFPFGFSPDRYVAYASSPEDEGST